MDNRSIQIAIAAVWMRGGTSKGLFFHARDLPEQAADRDRLLLGAIGSPDPYGRQIDGVGGATSSTSKVVIISPSNRPDCDVDYLFGHVAIDRPLIDWSGNCGNLSAAVGPFAIEEGLVDCKADTTRVRVWQANTGKRFTVDVLTPGGTVAILGDCRIAGVSGSAAPIRLRYLEPGGGSGLALLPSGRAVDRLAPHTGAPIDASLVNAGNPTVFVRATDLGLSGTETADQVDSVAALRTRLESIRAAGAIRMGLGNDPARISHERPGTPKICWLAPPGDYTTSAGNRIGANEIDLLARMMSLGRLHHAITGTGAIALAVARGIPGTIAHEIHPSAGESTLRIGHNAGIMSVRAKVVRHAGHWHAQWVELERTARRLMAGQVYVPPIPAAY